MGADRTGRGKGAFLPSVFLASSLLLAVLNLSAQEECRTFQRFSAQFQAALALADGPCPLWGASDQPSVRDAHVPTAATPMRTIRLRIHLFANSDGSNPAATTATVDQLMSQVNSAYQPWRVQFVYTTRQVNDSQFRNLADAEETAMKSRYAESPATQHNVFVVNIESPYNGWSTFPWWSEALTAQGGTVMDDNAFAPGRTTLIHELGHAVGLWHTHHGVSEVGACSSCYERPEASDGDWTGDFCSDTPPTPVSWSCGNPGGTDTCSGRPWGTTDYHNFMSYSSCRSRFTSQQAGRMHAWIEERLMSWLRNDPPPVSLADALDVPTLSWAAGGTAAWYGQQAESHDGVDAARSGAVGDNQQSWLQTTIAGPRTVSFWWKVSSEADYDYLRLLVDGVEVAKIGGEVDWTRRSVELAGGSHTLRWRYTKDSSESRGSDRGWVDQVVLGNPPAPALVYVDARYTLPDADGTQARPYPRVVQGHERVAARGIVRIRAGAYAERLLFNRPMTLEAYDGLVQIGVAGGTGTEEPGGENLPNPKPIRLSPPALGADGSFGMTFSGEPGRRYQVLTSADLTAWELWKDFTLEAETVEVTFPPPIDETMRFFKVLTP